MKKSPTPKTSKSKTIQRTLHYFWQALMTQKLRTFLLLILIPVYVYISSIIWPRGTSEIIGKLSSGDFELSNYAEILLSTILPVAFNNLILIRIIDWIDWSIDAKCGEYLAKMTFDAIINQSMTFHSNHFSGSLTSSANKFVGAFIDIKSNFTWNMYPLILTIIYSISAAISVCPPFAGILVIFATIYTIIATTTYYKTRRIDEELAEAENKQTGQLADAVTNMLNVKSYARESHEKARFSRATKRTREATYNVAKVSCWRNLMMNGISLTTTV
ncbi:MAG: ABC transporter transmembrane domain-containing protein, partial [Candidatus Saccharibacteria bacterium]|nr:ABC transporter transmembrane domain-containing protein [Candidatus Saccharibacteria bacterium]